MPGDFCAYCPSMKYPTLQKASAITIALVACFALGARAGGNKAMTAQAAKNDGSNKTSMTRTTGSPAAPLETLWYNGDFDGEATGNGLTNEEDTFATGYSHIHDDFNVPAGPGWDVGAIFSNNLASTNIIAATYEIRQGVSAFNGGTLLFSGMTSTPEVFATGRSGFGFTEFTVQINDLSIHLDGGQTYWLNVTPVDSLDGGRSFNSTTLGANCVGTPCGNNDNAFLDSTLFGAFFQPTLDFCGNCADFSMGILSGQGGGGDIVLEGRGRHRGDGPAKALLRWSPADGGQVNVLRNGSVIATVPDNGKYRDIVGDNGGTFTYQVCETDSGDCSNEVVINIP